MKYQTVAFSELTGKTLVNIYTNFDQTELLFITSENEIYKLYHEQNCCEHVSLEDVCGEFEDILFNPILLAEEVTHENTNPPGVPIKEWQDSYTWTFYKLSTRHGSVTLRWYGESNGYYSEQVEFIKLK